jgi:hypothetical protein
MLAQVSHVAHGYQYVDHVLRDTSAYDDVQPGKKDKK